MRGTCFSAGAGEGAAAGVAEAVRVCPGAVVLRPDDAGAGPDGAGADAAPAGLP